jgi:orotate phosphoribosyltransferase
MDSVDIKKGLCDVLNRVGAQVSQNPGATYKIPRALGDIARYKNQSVSLGDRRLLGQITLIENHLQSIWGAICSASSGYIQLNDQLTILKALCEYMQSLSDCLASDTRDCLETLTGEFTEQYEKLRRGIQPIAPKDLTHFDNDRLEKLPEHRREIIRAIIESGAFQYHNEPIFLLKSGYRSFYFFNGARLTHHAPSARIFPKLIAEKVKQIISRNDAPARDKIALGFARRITGETGGASSMAGSLAAELSLPSVTLPPEKPESFFSRTDGSSLSNDTKIVLIDDVVVTGDSASRHVMRFEKELKRAVYGYFTILDRRIGFRPSPLEHVVFSSGATKEDLISIGLWKPEILCISPESPLLSAIDLTADYLLEISLYLGRSLEDYQNLRQDMVQLARKISCQELPNENIRTNYIINLLMLTFLDLEKLFRKLREEANG